MAPRCRHERRRRDLDEPASEALRLMADASSGDIDRGLVSDEECSDSLVS
jgi:hypothetical protein